jgi:hypothetical protein
MEAEEFASLHDRLQTNNKITMKGRTGLHVEYITTDNMYIEW